MPPASHGRFGASVCLTACWAFSVLATASAAPPEEARRTSSRPNVLFIALDDLNDWIGCLGGHPQAKTPHMDGLARAGTVFLNAHCQAPLCNPTRTSLLLGLRPSTTGVYALDPWFRTADPLDLERVSPGSRPRLWEP